MKLNEAFELHDTLNPKIWDIKTNKLLPEVREKIIYIVSEFEKYLNAPIVVCDVHLVGSNASYNYNDTSDLDVHIIANYEQASDNPDLLQLIYTMKKTNFNKSYDIKIHGIEIEMYVQDIKSSITSNGIYSVCDDEWIKEPQPITGITRFNTTQEVGRWEALIDNVIKSGDYDEISNAINTLYLVRHNSIAKDGEFGKGNQIFKDIRSLGLLNKLRDALQDAQSKRLSLEDLDKGKFISDYDEE